MSEGSYFLLWLVVSLTVGVGIVLVVRMIIRLKQQAQHLSVECDRLVVRKNDLVTKNSELLKQIDMEKAKNEVKASHIQQLKQQIQEQEELDAEQHEYIGILQQEVMDMREQGRLQVVHHYVDQNAAAATHMRHSQ